MSFAFCLVLLAFCHTYFLLSSCFVLYPCAHAFPLYIELDRSENNTSACRCLLDAGLTAAARESGKDGSTEAYNKPTSEQVTGQRLQAAHLVRLLGCWARVQPGRSRDQVGDGVNITGKPSTSSEASEAQSELEFGGGAQHLQIGDPEKGCRVGVRWTDSKMRPPILFFTKLQRSSFFYILSTTRASVLHLPFPTRNPGIGIYFEFCQNVTVDV